MPVVDIASYSAQFLSGRGRELGRGGRSSVGKAWTSFATPPPLQKQSKLLTRGVEAKEAPSYRDVSARLGRQLTMFSPFSYRTKPHQQPKPQRPIESPARRPIRCSYQFDVAQLLTPSSATGIDGISGSFYGDLRKICEDRGRHLDGPPLSTSDDSNAMGIINLKDGDIPTNGPREELLCSGSQTF